MYSYCYCCYNPLRAAGPTGGRRRGAGKGADADGAAAAADDLAGRIRCSLPMPKMYRCSYRKTMSVGAAGEEAGLSNGRRKRECGLPFATVGNCILACPSPPPQGLRAADERRCHNQCLLNSPFLGVQSIKGKKKHESGEKCALQSLRFALIVLIDPLRGKNDLTCFDEDRGGDISKQTAKGIDKKGRQAQRHCTLSHTSLGKNKTIKMRSVERMRINVYTGYVFMHESCPTRSYVLLFVCLFFFVNVTARKYRYTPNANKIIVIARMAIRHRSMAVVSTCVHFNV